MSIRDRPDGDTSDVEGQGSVEGGGRGSGDTNGPSAASLDDSRRPEPVTQNIFGASASAIQTRKVEIVARLAPPTK
jgi:hypothetical protein